MATYSSTFNTGYKIIAEVTTISQNVTSNYSEINIKTYIQSTGSSYTISSSVQKSGTITIGQSGQTIYYNGGNLAGPVNYGFWCYVGLSGNQKKLLNDVTFICYHNSDGSLSIPISVSVNIAINFSSGYRGTVSCSGTYSPSKFSRASTFSLNVSSVTLGSTQITVSIARSSSSFTHQVFYSVNNNTSSTRLVNNNSSVGTSISFTPPLDDVKYIPNSTSATATISVDTYNGSTYIGSTFKTLSVNVPSSTQPTVSLTVTEEGGGLNGVYVKGKSKAKISINASASQGASITERNTTVTGMSSNSGTSFTTAVFTTAGTKTITTTVKDSRGRTASASKTITVQDYIVPTYSFNAIRCNSGGTEDATNGTYCKFTYSITGYSDLNSSNTLTWKIYLSSNNGSSWTLVTQGTGLKSSTSTIYGSGTLSTDTTYKAKMQITDAYGTYTKIVDIPTAYVTMDFLQGGKGIAFGKVANLNDTFECNMYSQFNRPIHSTRGTYCHQSGGTGGQNGYIKFGTITVTGTYADGYILITVARRKDQVPKELIIKFKNGDTKDPELESFYVRGTIGNFYIYKSATSTWDLYALKNESYDNVGVLDIQMSKYQFEKVDVTWHDGVQVSTLPSGYVTATSYNSFMIPSSGSWWNTGTPVVDTNGVMEIGKFIDFHFTNDTTNDYDSRMRIGDTGNVHFTGGVYPHETNKVRLGSENYRWTQLYLRDSPNVSSDRNMKENIVYVKNEKAKSESVDEVVTYEDMYNFVKDDLELATYNFINSEEQKMNFIAQDLLVNADGTDNKVGQMIVNPIAPPTEEEIAEAESHLEEDEVYTYPTLSYDVGMYISVLAGALKTALNKIDMLEEQIQLLQNDTVEGEK